MCYVTLLPCRPCRTWSSCGKTWVWWKHGFIIQSVQAEVDKRKRWLMFSRRKKSKTQNTQYNLHMAFKFSDLVEQNKFLPWHKEMYYTAGACIRAMEGGTLSVLAKEDGWYLWEKIVLSLCQVARVCALLQRHRLPPSLLWRKYTCIPLSTRSQTDLLCYPVAMSALSHMEFLWQDLGAVEAWIHLQQRHGPASTLSVQAEVDKRKRWLTSPRRAWLTAVVVSVF